MKVRAHFLTAAALLMIAAAALSLTTLRARQKLGLPGLPISSVPIHDENGAVARAESIQFPRSIPGFTFSNAPVLTTELSYLPPDTTFGRGRYTAVEGSWSASASAVLMGTDRTSIHRPEYCLQGIGWEVGQPYPAQVTLADGTSLDVQRLDTHATEEQEGHRVEVAGVYVYWFIADGRRTASHWERQYSIIHDLLLENTLPRWAYVSFFTTCRPGDEDEAFRRLGILIAQSEPLLSRSTTAVRAAR